VIRLGGVTPITPKVIEGLFATDLAYLQKLYNEVNRFDGGQVEMTCPQCGHDFAVEEVPLGGSSATASTSSARR